MSKSLLPLLLALSALAGCAGESKNEPNLEVACALTECVCISGAGGFFERNFDDESTSTTAVLWTEQGNAYCPEGFSLQHLDEEKKEKKKNQYYTPS